MDFFRKKKFLFYFLLVCLSWNCQKPHSDEFQPPPVITDATPGNSSPVSASFRGRVVDLQGIPLSAVTVTAGTRSSLTNENGEFELINATVDSLAGLVKASKPGYLNGFRTLIVSKAFHYVEFRLIREEKQGSVVAGTGGTVTFNNGGSATFAANAFISADSTPYTGKVDVMAHFIDPTTPGFETEMPGNLLAIDRNNAATVLTSFGMLAVEMRSENNQPVKLAAGKPATLHFPIPAALLSKAPASIPLWYFDETKGLWKEEGSAVKTGNEYVGQVAHFSFWNCDVPNDYVMLEAVLQTPQGAPLSFVKVDISAGDAGTTSGYANESGMIQGFVPKGKPLHITVKGECDENIYSVDHGPFTQMADLGIIKIQIAPDKLIQFVGDAVNCNNEPVTSGRAEVHYNGKVVATTIENGHYSLSLLRCSGQAEPALLYLVDFTGGKEITFSLDEVADGLNTLPGKTLCDALTNSTATISIDGNTFSFVSPTDSLSYTPRSIIVQRRGANPKISCWFSKDLALGEVPVSAVYYTDEAGRFYYPTGTASATITAFDNYVAGSVSATITRDSGRTVLPIIVNFNMKTSQ
ncbi:carboxypeptidase-like regulatory domain-containing protein [Flavihumibacter petaseus]|uniref:Carboxypeptidase regulatory-like domain-containing protein n=1 Tax=Flavihumibacter petaseus NBRC 106054 TaxID=1220578 RepID=A0A0E9N342_9BACT|nr:carboxypeptidase-like regulatory domain-containing protein [Flavihumibacter petaseus]GAO44377.1 hypothetical protein FPE01S_03_04150 [Flavihumibacter petaseus NBRC 106054]